jgi:hypothetical protein
MNTLTRAQEAIKACTEAEKNYLRLWLNGGLDQLIESLEKQKEMKTNE